MNAWRYSADSSTNTNDDNTFSTGKSIHEVFAMLNGSAEPPLVQEGVEATYYGRHIDIENIEVELYELKDLFDVTARRFGI